jgi:hypothetical protein
MNQKPAKTWAMYLGVAASISVPAVVIAQQQQRNPPADGTFGAQTLLRAADVEQLRDALADAITRINDLQANVTFTKGNIYAPTPGTSGPIAINGVGTATTSCEDNDILVGCSCEGRFNGTNQLAFDLRRVSSSNRLDGTSFCTCQGVNVGTNDGRELVSIAQCLEVP